MAFQHAVLLIDHHNAEILQFGAGNVQAEKLHAHRRYTRQHGSEVRTEHEFFAQVCDALDGIGEVLVAGGHLVQGDFRHYLEKHRPEVTRQVTGWETVDHPSEAQLLALAKKHFSRVDKLAGKMPLH